MPTSDPESGEPYRMPAWEEADGSIRTDPGPDNEYAKRELQAVASRPKGPKPVLPAPQFKSGAAEQEPGAPAPEWIGKPGPRDNKYIMGHNAGGPYIKFVEYGERRRPHDDG